MSSSAERAMTVGEEVAHSLTHGLGCLLGVAGTILLVGGAHGGMPTVYTVAAGIYGASLVFLYAASTLFHALPPGPAKRMAQTLDHVAIFLLIAGTYTPFALVGIEGSTGNALFGVEWVLAGIGIAHELTRGEGGARLQLVLYLVMGWAVLAVLGPMAHAIPAGGLWLLFGGGVFYSVGVIFYVREQVRWNHAIWHLFVLAGSACHFGAIYFFVMPR